MTECCFLQFYSDTTPPERSIPALVRITAESREQAIQEFARWFGLNVDSDDGDTVWFVRDNDGAVFQYAVVRKENGTE